ncbi:MAG: nucleotidyltransferase family protein [Pyrinomonadaceae bacterium]
MIRHGIILAAGRGMRMAPLTDAIPKPMAPYNGTTLIARGISRLAERLEHIHVTVGYKKAMLAQHVIEHGASSVFNTEGKSNCWWIYNTMLSQLDEPMVVLTCDNVVDLDFELLEENYLSLNSPACMLVPVRPVPGLEGDYVFQENHFVKEISRLKETEIYCSGIQVLNPHRLNQITREGDSFYEVWQQLIDQQQLFVSSVYPKRWYAVDTIEQLTTLNKSPF